MTAELSYEQQRLQNIKDNEALLLSLGLSAPDRPKLAPRKTVPSLANKKPRKSTDGSFKPTTEDDGAENSPVKKKQRLARRSIAASTGDEASPGPRRSSRSTQRPSYLRDREGSSTPSELRGTPKKRTKRIRQDDDSNTSEDEEQSARQRNAQRLGVRTQDPKTFGHIPGVEVGRWWATRMDASTDAVHAPTVAGISGNAQDGAWSVALSGGYPDDIDLGYAFTYTGSGGRDLKGTKQNPKNLRTAPQTSHQTFDNSLNAALKRSAETRNPVRVIRGFKLQSKYAPPTGYRYDGLYIVEKAWMGKGLTKGLMVCRYAFKRMEGQDAIPERDDDVDGDD